MKVCVLSGAYGAHENDDDYEVIAVFRCRGMAEELKRQCEAHELLRGGLWCGPEYEAWIASHPIKRRRCDYKIEEHELL